MDNFLSIPANRILHRGKHFFIIRDAYPVSPGHSLIISNVPHKDFFDLSVVERQNLAEAVFIAKGLIEKEFTPDGYNIGMNCGECAGQTVFHFHCHLIPRYIGDVDNPKGGIRHCIHGKGYY